MKCPKCQQEMVEKGNANTNNGKSAKNYKEYKRIVHWCSKDDIWVSVETPKP